MTIDLGFAWTTLPVGERRRVRRRARARAVRAEHAGRRRPGARGAVRGGGRRRLDAAVGRAPGRHRRARHQPRPARGHPQRPGRSRPGDARRRSTAARATSLGAVPAVAVSAVTGAGLPELRDALDELAGGAARRPTRPPRSGSGSTARSASRGSGTVVTGTLPAGTVTAGRGTAAHPVAAAGQDPRPGVAERAGRVGRRGGAGGGQPARRPGRFPARGMALVEPGRWTLTRRAGRAAVGSAIPR